MEACFRGEKEIVGGFLMENKKKIIFFGNWGIGKKALEYLINFGFKPSAVVTQYELNSEDEYYNIVYKIAEEKKFPVFTSLKEFYENFLINADSENYIGICVAFNKKIPEYILSMLDIINFHPSILPGYRGSSPILWQIKDRLPYIGITAHYMTEDWDWGEIINQMKLPVDYRMSFESLIEYSKEQVGKFIIRTLNL